MQGKFLHRQMDFAAALIREYSYEEPFHLYLKKYFSKNKRHGSRDRKNISELCYGYFRLGNGVISLKDVEAGLLLGYYLFHDDCSQVLSAKPDWQATVNLPLEEKLSLVRNQFDPDKIFPFSEKLSEQIPLHEWNLSMLQQPHTFIRIRPGKMDQVVHDLLEANIPFTSVESNVLSFPSGITLSDVINIDKDAVIQDFNSAKTLSLLAGHQAYAESVWDCCAGSGGKSILFHDLFPNARITVSDTRKQILNNLKIRFRNAGIRDYNLAKQDMSRPQPSKHQYDLIIADVPCSGSGTWARTPERLTGFGEADLKKYLLLQSQIMHHALPALEKNGYLLYITCSIYAAENEEMATRMQQDEGLHLLESRYLKGYDKHADTLYTALFQKL